jgi:hypothetical protein
LPAHSREVRREREREKREAALGERFAGALARGAPREREREREREKREAALGERFAGALARVAPRERERPPPPLGEIRERCAGKACAGEPLFFPTYCLRE